jgi:Domain of unknown function (DUF222)
MDAVKQTPGTPLVESFGADTADLLDRCRFDREMSDHELVEVMVAARRLASRAQAVELAAVAELARRRFAEDATPAVEAIRPRDYLNDEVAAALTLTPASADDLIRFATGLTGRLPGIFAALAAGDVDYLNARTLWHGTRQVSDEVTAAIEAKVLPRAPGQTTGEIRAKVRRLVKKLDPHALAQRCADAERRRGLTLIPTDDGTADLSGVDLPADAAGAAYSRVAAIAAGIKRDGDGRQIDQLRADVYLALLRGTLNTTEPPADTSALRADATGSRADTSALRADATGSRADTSALRADTSAHPNAGPVTPGAPGWTDADDVIADLIAGTARTQLTALTTSSQGLLDPHHQVGALVAQAGARITESLTALRISWCLPACDNPRRDGLGREVAGHGVSGYRLPAAMRRLIEHRDRRCCFPGCRRPVRHCDADHSIPFHRGGTTCPCNIAMLCRRHHRLKQTPGWRLEHLWPGVLIWIAPTGHWKITAPADRE